MREIEVLGTLKSDNAAKVAADLAASQAALDAARERGDSDTGLAAFLTKLKADIDLFAGSPLSPATPTPGPDLNDDGIDAFASFHLGQATVKGGASGGPLFPNRPKLRNLFQIRKGIVAEMVKGGISPIEAEKVVGQLGDGHIIDLLIKYGPMLYAIARAIALMFGFPLPPLPFGDDTPKYTL